MSPSILLWQILLHFHLIFLNFLYGYGQIDYISIHIPIYVSPIPTILAIPIISSIPTLSSISYSASMALSCNEEAAAPGFAKLATI